MRGEYTGVGCIIEISDYVTDRWGVSELLHNVVETVMADHVEGCREINVHDVDVAGVEVCILQGMYQVECLSDCVLPSPEAFLAGRETVGGFRVGAECSV